MSTRSTRKKSLPPKLLELEEESTPRTSRKRAAKTKERSSTPSSRVSSPDSRASSPGVTRPARGSSAKKPAKTPKGRGPSVGRTAGTPASSRASSVTPAVKKKRGRTPGAKKSKLKGHNPDYNAAYHYGSDFEQEDEYEENDIDKSSETEESDVEEDSDDMKPESDVEIEPIIQERDSFTPVPFWCQDYANIPELHLPPSSEDLCVDQEHVLELVSIYEILRQFRTIIRLSPFRIEDFACALKADEHSNLLSEIHIALMKCLWREDDNLQIQYSPMDQKDSVNVLLYMYDNVTWPENLKFFLSSDPESNQESLDIMNTTEYPFTSIKNKLTVLHNLTNSVLASAAVREDLATEGQLPAEDHCRVCHRLGDMVICEHCNGPFHGTCLEPPLYEIPEEDWICPVCADHMVDGVFDALTSNPGDARHDVIGVDRRGSKYWWLARRLWVEDLDGGCRYYSTKQQLEEVMEVLDPQLYEADLIEGLKGIKEDLEQHMEITLKLTGEKKPVSKSSYLEMDNNALEKVQEERKALKEQEKEERKNAQEQVDKLIREEDESRKLAEIEMKKKIRDDRMNERAMKRGDGFPDELGDDSEPILEQVAENDLDNNMDVSENVNEETVEEVVTNNGEDDNIPSSASNSTKPTRSSSPILIKKPELPPGDYFKLGQEGTFKHYVNQYTAVTHALSRNQVKEDAEKKTRLSHKFSLTDVSTYKWMGATEGSRGTILTAVRTTILKLEEMLPQAFMHANWPILRRPWMQAVNTSSSPSKDFARALTVLVMCIKPSILLPVWMDSLGHINIKKIQSQAKEEKKKADKKEKKEREDEEERLKPWMTWVKYTLPVRSLTVTRQKGEDYRAHGRNGWMWLSSGRVVKSQDSSKMGLRAGPYRIAVKYTELKNNTNKIVLIEPKACAFLMKVQKERDDKELTRMVTGEEEVEEEDDSGKEKTDEEKRKDNLKKLLDTSRIDMQEPSDEELGQPDGVIDVSAAFQNSARTLYSKNAKKCSIDDLLSRRIQLKNWEMKKIELLNKPKDEAVAAKTEDEKEQSTVITSDIVEKVPETENIETWINNSKRRLMDAVKMLRDCEVQKSGDESSKLQCYSAVCAAGDSSQCYSSTCTIKQEKEMLDTLTKVYTTVVREGKMKEAVKIDLAENFSFTDTKQAGQMLTDLVKTLLLKAKELSEQTMQSITPSTTKSEATTNGIKEEDSTVVKSETKSDVKSEGITNGENVKPELKRPAFSRCYSMEDTSGTLYLKRIQSVADSKKTSRVVKYPLASTFCTKSKQMRSILVLVKHELKRLSRNAGQVQVDGFNYAAKPNSGAWPYPCPRPLFRTSWMWRTASMTSLHTVAMQLRILWMCIKWDDMATKPPALYDGKNQVTTDSEIVTTEILKHRNIGRYMENTQYWQRKISIPLDAPRKQVDYSPIRSGLRKRKRAESPVSADPRVEEVWVDELTLELWEIRAYRDRVDRERERLTTRRQAGIITKAPERLDPSEDRKTRIFNQNLQEIKQRTEENLRQQREAFKSGRVDNNIGGIIKTVGSSGIKLISSKADNSIGNTAKKIFITKDGKIIGHQIAAPPGKVAIPNLTQTGKPPAAAVQTPAVQSPAAPVQQKVQIVKSADGKIQVRGLLPGQQLVQMPDGRLQIFSNQPVPGQSPGKTGENSVIQTSSQPQQQVKLISGQPGQPQLIQQQPQQLLPKPAQIVQAGGGGAIQSPTKTYTIQRNPNIVQPQPSPNTPIQPKPQVQQSPAPAPAPAGGKQKVVGIQSLGNNTVTIKDGQLIVQGPDHDAATAIAKQLASGQAKLGNVGGKQVLVILGQEEAAPATVEAPKPPTPPPPAPVLQQQVLQQQPAAQIIQQQPAAQIIQQQPAAQVLQQQPAAQIIQQQPAAQVVQQQPAAQVQQQQPAAQVQQQPAAQVVQQKQQPAGTVSSVTVTAQLVQTPQGPRIILQGLQGVQLEQQQLAQIQQQVKTQLLKQQAVARQQGKVPPTKVSIQLTGSFNRAQPQQPPDTGTAAQPAVNNDTTNSFEPPQLAVQPQQQQPPSVQPSSNSFLSDEPQVTNQQQPSTPVASKLAAQPTITANLPQSVIKQGHFIMKDGKKVLVLPQNVLQAHQARQKALLEQQQKQQKSPPGLPQHPQSILLNSLTSPLSPQKSLLSPQKFETDGDKFELTDDYIQQTIKSALNSGNLTLEQQEKLINQLDGSDMPDTVSRSAKGRRGKKAKPSVIDPASGEPMDDEWQPESWTEKRRLQNSIRRKQEPQSETKLIENDLDLNLDLELPSPVKSSPSPVRAARKVPAPFDDKKRMAVQNKLSSMLFKQKEQLKRDIAKKRALLEKELSVEINKEVDSLKQQAQMKLNAQKGISGGTKRPYTEISPSTPSPSLASATKKRRKSDRSGDDESPDNQLTPTGIKKDRLYCICKTKYDRTKFYVGCDICSNWFHGSCVGITAKMSKKMSEYICDECKSAKESEQLYCLCRQPYDDSQFYIGCEKCEDWFHGRCVGILQAEAENIEEYVCPKCEPNSRLNFANLKELNSQDRELITKTFKSIQSNRYSNPFKEPVDPKGHPKYYEVVKEPMDLKIIERKVNFNEYLNLAEFIGDVTKIFENCRYYNPGGQPFSTMAKSADNLEQFLVKQIGSIRDRVSATANQ